jgi:hypothetical protein
MTMTLEPVNAYAHMFSSLFVPALQRPLLLASSRRRDSDSDLVAAYRPMSASTKPAHRGDTHTHTHAHAPAPRPCLSLILSLSFFGSFFGSVCEREKERRERGEREGVCERERVVYISSDLRVEGTGACIHRQQANIANLHVNSCHPLRRKQQAPRDGCRAQVPRLRV